MTARRRRFPQRFGAAVVVVSVLLSACSTPRLSDADASKFCVVALDQSPGPSPNCTDCDALRAFLPKYRTWLETMKSMAPKLAGDVDALLANAGVGDGSVTPGSVDSADAMRRVAKYVDTTCG